MNTIQVLIITIFFVCSWLLFFPPRSIKTNKLLLAVIFSVLLIVITLRPEEMADYENYRLAFLMKGTNRFEIAFSGIKFFASLFPNVVLVGFFLYALLSLSIKYFVFLNTDKQMWWGMMLVYLSNVLIFQDMITIRVAVAGSIYLYSTKFMNSLEWKKLLLCFFISMLFHYTALILFLIFFLDSKREHRCWYLFFIIFSYALAISGYSLGNYLWILNDYDAYSNLIEMYDYEAKINIFNLLQLGRLAMCLFFWINVKDLISYNRNTLIYLKLYTIAICIIPLFFTSVVIAGRLSSLFMTIEILLIPMGFYSIFKSKFIGNLTLLLYSAIILYFSMTNLQYWNPSLLNF